MSQDSYVNYVDNLNDSYRSVFNQVVLYVGLLDGMSESRKDEKLGDLLDVMLSAQEAGKPVEKVCGRDVRTFCREFCAEYDIRFGIYEVLKSCRFLIWLMLIESVIFALGWFLDPEVRQSGSLFWLQVEDSLDGYVLIVTVMNLLSAMIGMVGRHIMFAGNRNSEKIVNGARLVLALIGIAAIVLIFVGEYPAICLPLGIQLIGSVILLGAGYYLRSVLKDDVDEGLFGITKKVLTDEIPADIDERFPAEMEKKYRLLRDKKQRKGISYSMEDFLKDEENTSMKMLRLRNFYFFLPVICSVMVLLTTSVGIVSESGDAANGVNSVIWGTGITFIVESIVMFFLWKAIKKIAMMRLAWIRKR